MILPHSNAIVLFLMILGLLCWGSWAAVFKFGAKKRSEIFYLDFALGAALAAAVCAYTFGSMGYDGFTVVDDLLNAGRHQVVYGFMAGALFNFGNMLLMAAVVVAGMAVAFPSAFAIAIVVAGGLNYLVNPGGRGPLLLAGGVVLLAAVVAFAVGQGRLAVLRHEALARAGKARSTRRPTSRKGMALAVAGGLVMGTSYPLLAKAQVVEIGTGPYTAALIFSLGMLACTMLLSLLFMNLPVEGEPLEIGEIFRTGIESHLLGIFGGGIWFVGLIAMQLATSPRADLRANAALSYALAQGAPLVAAIWGCLVFRELRGADGRVRILALLGLTLFALGLALVSLTRLPALAS